MWGRASVLLVGILVLSGCGATDQDSSPGTGGGGVTGSGGSGGIGGIGGSPDGGQAGASTVCKLQCTGPHTWYDDEYAECNCDDVYADSDPATCSASCSANPLTEVAVNVFIEHPAVGDLTVKLVAPDSTAVTLLNRPGFAETADDGADGLGSPAAIQKDMMVWFRDSALNDAEALGAGLSAGEIVCGGGKECKLKPAPGAAGGPASLDATFAGKSAEGQWQICVGDSNPGSAGTLYARGLFLMLQSPAGSVHSVGPAGTYPDGLAIPDGAYDGTLASMACTTLKY